MNKNSTIKKENTIKAIFVDDKWVYIMNDKILEDDLVTGDEKIIAKRNASK